MKFDPGGANQLKKVGFGMTIWIGLPFSQNSAHKDGNRAVAGAMVALCVLIFQNYHPQRVASAMPIHSSSHIAEGATALIQCEKPVKSALPRI